MKVIAINHRKLPLRFDIGAWSKISETVCPFSDLDERLKNERTRAATVMAVTAILANRGLEYLGLTPDVTESDIASASPRVFGALIDAIREVVTASMKMETAEEEQRERDLVLEELQKKST